MMRRIITRNGEVVSDREVSDKERQEAIDRYERTHPEAMRGTVKDCCGSAVPGKDPELSE